MMCGGAAAGARFEALQRWVLDHGGYVGPVAVQEPAPGLRGLFCTTNGVRAGEPLLAVPSVCTIRGDVEVGQRPIERLILALLHARDDMSTYAPYIDSLPGEVPLLRDWDEKQIERLQAPELATQVKDQRAWLERLCDGLREDRELNRADILWAERIVRSRGVSFTDAETGATGLQLVPLLDFANHRRHGPDATPPVIETHDGMIVLCAAPSTGDELNRGDEATFEYVAREEGNARLLRDYGFAQLGANEFVGLGELDTMLAAAPENVERLWAKW
jgi:hypothetical protein